MKKMLVATAVFAALSFTVNAQEEKHEHAAHEKTASQEHKKEEIAFKNGKVVQIVNGVETPVEKDITLKNGAVVSADGTVKTVDGTVTALKEGDVVAHDGKVLHSKEKEAKVLKGEAK